MISKRLRERVKRKHARSDEVLSQIQRWAVSGRRKEPDDTAAPAPIRSVRLEPLASPGRARTDES